MLHIVSTAGVSLDLHILKIRTEINYTVNLHSLYVQVYNR